MGIMLCLKLYPADRDLWPPAGDHESVVTDSGRTVDVGRWLRRSVERASGRENRRGGRTRGMDFRSAGATARELLIMQRAAGNAAVGSYLRSARSGLMTVQRDTPPRTAIRRSCTNNTS